MKRLATKGAWLAAVIFAAGLPLVADRPVLSSADEAFLRDQALRVAASAALAPGKNAGDRRNATPYRMRVPGGNMGYPAFWVRDAVMMLGGDLVPAAEVEDWIRLISGSVAAPADWQVRPGVVVPAFAVPDHINFDGRPTFYPGNYETGDKQGGEPWGKYPPLDDHFYFVIAVHHHWKMTGRVALFESRVKTSFGEMRLSDLCEKVFRVAPADPETGLVTAGDIGTENAKDWGFCDAVFKSGKLLFPSILKLVAARDLAELFRGCGAGEKSGAYDAEARRLRSSISATFFRAGGEPGEGWLHSATGIGNQPDVWGSAFAVWSGAVERETALAVSRSLVRAYRDKTAVKEGCVRHVLTTDGLNGGAWQKSVSAPGDYQNGGYWGTPAGWYIAAMASADGKAAADMAADYIRFLRSHMRPDGMSEAWEWFGDNGRTANPLYVATVALPYLSLLEAGLLTGGTGTSQQAF